MPRASPPEGRDLRLCRPTKPITLAKPKPHSPAEFSKLAVQLHPFTSERFHALFTLSSKYFSTFPHGTCSLSDSCKYLALDGVYHPLWAAITNNPTPRSTQGDINTTEPHPHGPFTLSGPSQNNHTHCWTWGGITSPKDDLNTTLPNDQMVTGFGAGLFPVHSPLLGESLLVSFPPLSDMLKFSGYSRLIRGQVSERHSGRSYKWRTPKISQTSYNSEGTTAERATTYTPLSHDSTVTPSSCHQQDVVVSGYIGKTP